MQAARTFFASRAAARLCSMLVALVALIVFGGWAFHVPLAESFLRGHIGMKLITATTFLLAAAALRVLASERVDRRIRRIGRSIAIIVTILGALSVVEYALGVDLRIDRIFVAEKPGAVETVNPGRMAPHTAIAFMLAGIAMLLLDAETRLRKRVSLSAATAVFLIALIVSLGYLYRIDVFRGFRQFSPMALSTALGFLFLGLGLMTARNDRGLMRILIAAGAGGSVARRLLPAAILLPILFGWLRFILVREELMSADLAVALLVAANLLTFAALVWWTALLINRQYRLLRAEQAKSEHLLLNILPAAVADRLKESEESIADAFPEVTVLFADIVGFTTMASHVAPEELIVILNSIFSEFDELATKHGLEKIKTIGDAYMVAGGVPNAQADHCRAVAEMGLDMLDAVATNEVCVDKGMRVRIGINCGPVVAGVIGHRKFIYDLWGDTVNIASRMESHGIPNEIQITEAVYRRLKDHYVCEPRGEVEIKGKQKMKTWLLRGRIEN